MFCPHIKDECPSLFKDYKAFQCIYYIPKLEFCRLVLLVNQQLGILSSQEQEYLLKIKKERYGVKTTPTPP